MSTACTICCSYDNSYHLMTTLLSETSCWQLWHLKQAVDSFDIWNKLLTALTTETSCWQLWHLKQSVNSFDSWNKLLTALTAEIGCRQLCQLEPAVDSRSYNKFQDIEKTLVSFGLATACVSEWRQNNDLTSVIGPTRSSISAKILAKQEWLDPILSWVTRGVQNRPAVPKTRWIV